MITRQTGDSARFTARKEYAMTKSPNRLLGVIFGAVYVLVGLLGFTVTAGVDFLSTDGGLLLGIFEVNPLHNIAHLLIGAALLIAGVRGVRPAKTVNGVVGAAYLLLGIIGLFIIDSAANILALNGADNVLHFGSAIVLLAVALGADKVTAGRRSTV
ncbi:MAG: hypothetical protein JWM51_756 [Microbacteriaceae bacterium]|jgi:hypothetical protein|nr:hypothetical protein [Microbacteriaceae bacterium]